ncbi:MAG: nucleotide exchange factor GrpE [Candidatus Bathyarchaeia archaeon]
MAASEKSGGKVEDLKEAPTDEIELLRKSLREEQLKAEEYLNRLKYLQADFDNYRKRVEKEVNEMIQLNSERLLRNFLDIIDELELAAKIASEHENRDVVSEGLKITLKKLYDILKREGLTPIETIGKPFDPNMHEVVSRIAVEGCPEGTVISEVRKGFLFKGKVIRPSMVNIAVAPKEGMGAVEEKK